MDAYWRDFAPVVTTAEAAEWDALAGDSASEASVAGICELLRRGWAERAARAGLTVEDRLALHYRRLAHARQWYYLTQERGRLGPQTRLLSVQVGRPEDAGLDDRGLVYVRLGEPDRKASFMGIGNPFRMIPIPKTVEEEKWEAASRDLVISDECYHPNESWAYDYPDGTRVYHFSPLEGAADWWLLENLYDVYVCGDPTAAVTIAANWAGTATLSPLMGQRPAPPSQVAWLVLSDLYMSRSGVDGAYGTLGHQLFTSGPDDFEEMAGLRNLGIGALRAQAELAEERQTNYDAAEEVLTTVSERPAVRAEVPMMFELLQYRMAGLRPGEDITRVWLNAVAAGQRLLSEPLADGGFRYRVRAILSVVDATSELRHQEMEFSLTAAQTLDDEAGLPVRLAVDLAPGEYSYTLVLRDANDEDLRPAGNWRSDSLHVRSYGASVPQLSDVAFAPDSGGMWSPAPGVALPISPVHRTDGAGRAWLYLEAYGLSPSGNYVTEVKLEPNDGAAFTLTYPGTAPSTPRAAVRRVLRLDLGDTDRGEYTVRITVIDAQGRRSLPIETSIFVQ